MPSQVQPTTLVELLAERSGDAGGYVAVTADGDTRRMSFAELFEVSSIGAAVIVEAGMAGFGPARDRAVITVADPLSFIVALFSALRAGCTPVPAPSGTGAHPAHLRRFQGIVRSAQPALIITDGSRVQEVAGAVEGRRPQVVAVEELTAARTTGSFRHPQVTSEDPAYLQYTSGSTSEPKPAVLLHRNVMAELRLAARAYEESTSSVSVHWVPLYHGMGLVCSILRPLYTGYTSVILDPTEFLHRPSSWLEQLSAWRASHTSSPTFGYAFTVASRPDPSGLDLSPLRVARVSSEMVPYSTLHDFAEQLKDTGFTATAFCPSYGLVEATLAVTSCPAAEEPRLVTVSRSAFRDGVATATAEGAEDVLQLVSSGPPLPETTVRILDRSGRPVGEAGEIGEVWISGPQVVPVPGDEIDGAAGRRTGDLGFLFEGDLVPVGRNTERFKVRGVNFYSTEIETLIPAADPRFRTGRVAAFVAGEPGRESGLIVVAEIGSDAPDSTEYLHDLQLSAVRTVSRSLGISVARVVLVGPGALPMTTSGKLRRDVCRTLLESGELDELTGPEESTHVKS